MDKLLEILPYILLAPFSLAYLVMTLDLRYRKKISIMILAATTIILGVVEGLVLYYVDVKDRYLLVFSLVFYLPTCIVLLLIGRKKGMSFITGCFNLFIPLYFLSVASNIAFELANHFEPLKYITLCVGGLVGAVFVYFGYKKLHNLFEKMLPKQFWILFLYAVISIATIYVFDQFVNERLARVIFSFAILLVYLISIIFMYVILSRYNITYQENQDLVLMKGQVQAIQDQYKMREIKEQELKILRHDMKHILLNLHQLIQEDKKDEAIDFINNYINVIDATKTKTYCKEPIINSILDYYYNKAINDEVNLNMVVQGIDDALNIPPFEISVLISNCLDNAIKAAAKLKNNRMVDFKFINNDGRVILQCKNNYDGILLIDKDGRPTNLAKGHGLGSDSIELFAKKYNLTIDYDISENIYKITILF